MAYENGEWIIRGVGYDDESRLKNADDLIRLIDTAGFLPLFKNEIEGFSVEEHTLADYWWSGDEENDPWEWRKAAAASGRIAYGKFFDKRSGFISKEWFPHFANYRRDGYDFDARWDDEKATLRCKKIMDVFEKKDEMFSYEIKREAGFGKGGEKNFEGTLCELMMQSYLMIHDFRQKINRNGIPYGWHVAVYSKPETVWGEDHVTSCYSSRPEESKRIIFDHIRSLYPSAKEGTIEKMLK
ncbi:MAG: hypothetical protein IJS94_01520 [Clostridia bacterium]|nr:hypothetical protein [Clostridia bacterium]